MKPLVVLGVGWRNLARLVKYSTGTLLGLFMVYLVFGVAVALGAGVVVVLVVWALVRIVRAES